MNTQDQETEVLNAMPQAPRGLGQEGALTAALRGKDTRPTFNLKGIDGKPLKVPPLEVSVYLMYEELALMREMLLKLVNQGMK